MRKYYFPCMLAELSFFSVVGWQKGFGGVWGVLICFKAMWIYGALQKGYKGFISTLCSVIQESQDQYFLHGLVSPSEKLIQGSVYSGTRADLVRSV